MRVDILRTSFNWLWLCSRVSSRLLRLFWSCSRASSLLDCQSRIFKSVSNCCGSKVSDGRTILRSSRTFLESVHCVVKPSVIQFNLRNTLVLHIERPQEPISNMFLHEGRYLIE